MVIRAVRCSEKLNHVQEQDSITSRGIDDSMGRAPGVIPLIARENSFPSTYPIFLFFPSSSFSFYVIASHEGEGGREGSGLKGLEGGKGERGAMTTPVSWENGSFLFLLFLFPSGKEIRVANLNSVFCPFLFLDSSKEGRYEQ